MSPVDTGGLFAGADVADAVPLAPLTTLRIGPVARRMITCSTTEQVIATLGELDAEARADAAPATLIFGGGSNLVIDDALTGLTAVRMANDRITIDGDRVRAEAGAVWDDVVLRSLEAGLGGLECLSGIPGSAGATPVQNVGAYGVEVGDTISAVRILDRNTGTTRWVPAGQLGFGYRTSVLRPDRGDGLAVPQVVLEVEFTLHRGGRSAPLRYAELAAALDVPPGTRADPTEVRRAVLALRGGKGMVLDPEDHDTWSAGSFFTNPVVELEVYEQLAARWPGPVPRYPASDGVKLAAGWLVEQAGFAKGYPGDLEFPQAPCRLSTKHALALTNRGWASTADLLALARTVRDGVHAAFGITLVPEPIFVGCTL